MRCHKNENAIRLPCASLARKARACKKSHNYPMKIRLFLPPGALSVNVCLRIEIRRASQWRGRVFFSSICVAGLHADWPAFIFGTKFKPRRRKMGRGLGWLLGTLVFSVIAFMALNGVCQKPYAFPALTKFFCPQPRAVAGPQPPTRTPTGDGAGTAR